jgi:predicted metalloprotease with PDZ domain
MIRFSRSVLFGGAFCLLAAVLGSAQSGVINLAVDATEGPRKIFHAQLDIPASAGTLTLLYPKWIPGEHGPTGPIQNLTGLKFTANGQELKWRRDLKDGWTFHVDVPSGVTSVHVSLDFTSPAGHEGEGIYTGGATATAKLALLDWHTVLLYPAGPPSDQLQYKASLRLPAGWKYSTSLNGTDAGNEVRFKPVSLTELVDAPVLAGEYFRVVPLADNPRTELDMASDSPGALQPPQIIFDEYKQLVEQAQRLFGAHHYRDYHFLFTLSDHVAHFGLEHHESDDSRVPEMGMVNDSLRIYEVGLLPHEYVHSWNGKYRRPADLATSDYQQTMQDDLLWVYEGLTSYLGDVLSARSGLRNPDQFRDNLAVMAADLDHKPGRTWRNLQDTADGVPAMQGAPRQWESWRRGLDYYDEDVLNWLWVDTIIREQSKGKRSIDDFCHLFHGEPSGPPALKTYTFEDVVNTLNQVAPYDWRNFWTERLTNHGPGAPLNGLLASGWRLVYDENPSELWRASEEYHRGMNASYSIGISLAEDATIIDSIEGMVAAKAGIGPGMKVIAVNGRRYTPEVLKAALRQGKAGTSPLELLIENNDYFTTYRLDYHGGEQYPHLVREDSKPDVMGDIIKPR